MLLDDDDGVDDFCVLSLFFKQTELRSVYLWGVLHVVQNCILYTIYTADVVKRILSIVPFPKYSLYGTFSKVLSI